MKYILPSKQGFSLYNAKTQSVVTEFSSPYPSIFIWSEPYFFYVEEQTLHAYHIETQNKTSLSLPTAFTPLCIYYSTPLILLGGKGGTEWMAHRYEESGVEAEEMYFRGRLAHRERERARIDEAARGEEANQANAWPAKGDAARVPGDWSDQPVWAKEGGRKGRPICKAEAWHIQKGANAKVQGAKEAARGVFAA